VCVCVCVCVCALLKLLLHPVGGLSIVISVSVCLQAYLRN